MFTLYIPKFKGESVPFKIQLLVNLISEFMLKSTNCKTNSNHPKEVGIIMIPGYLSVNDATIDYFTSIIPIKSNSAIDRNTVYLCLLKGMNNSSPQKIGVNNKNNNTRLSNIEIYNHHIQSYKNKGLKIIDCNLSDGSSDHSKVIVFFEVISHDTKDHNSVFNKLKLAKQDIDSFIESVQTVAIIIGSSNQSCNTYFGNKYLKPNSVADKGESDILLFTEKSLSREIEEKLSEYINNDETSMILSETTSVKKGFNAYAYLNSIVKEYLTGCLR